MQHKLVPEGKADRWMAEVRRLSEAKPDQDQADCGYR